MDLLIVLALVVSPLASMLLTAWILHRHHTGQSPIPTVGRGVETSEPDPDEDHPTPKGRHIL